MKGHRTTERGAVIVPAERDAAFIATTQLPKLTYVRLHCEAQRRGTSMANLVRALLIERYGA